MQRDKSVNAFLLSRGWKVIRFWSAFIKKNLSDCIRIIEKEVEDSTLSK
jgi:DNA mismatch endonuclease (patch repair protein)